MNPAHILTLNAGSSSIKFALFRAAELDVVAMGQIEGLGSAAVLKVSDGRGNRLAEDVLDGEPLVDDHAGALRTILAFLKARFGRASIAAVGHRIVHGGALHTAPALLDDARVAALEALVPLAPLHQPHNLKGVQAARAAFPGVPQVACFDTAFHRDQPFVNEAFAIPRQYYDAGVRRYGFHGLSYEYVTRELRRLAPDLAGGRVVICHLGSGASMCAIHAGRSVTSSMGFSPLDGLPMGTRPGQIDPGVLLYLMQHEQMDAGEISDLLYRHSGLLGLSGLSGDMRVLEASPHLHAQQAIDYFVSRVRRELGAMAALLGGLDTVVFTGGIGENSSAIRAQVLDTTEWLGIELDRAHNEAGHTVISAAYAPVSVLVIRTNEELMIAEHTARVAGLRRHDQEP